MVFYSSPFSLVNLLDINENSIRTNRAATPKSYIRNGIVVAVRLGGPDFIGEGVSGTFWGWFYTCYFNFDFF